MIAFPPFSGFVRHFVIVCVLIYFAMLAGSMILGPQFAQMMFVLFGLQPAALFSGMIWQPLTWVLLHSLNEPFHIIFNMLAFWMFGSLVELQFGTARFIRFCLYATLFCAASVIVLGLFDSNTWMAATVGASGIVYAVLIAVARMFPNQMVIFLIFPMKMKYLAMILIGINLFYPLTSSGASNISYIAHLGGALFGYVYISWLNSQSGGGHGGGSGEDWLSRMRSHWDKKKKRRHLRIVTPEDDHQNRWNSEGHCG